MLNIIGGRKKRLKLEVPISGVRPTSSKKRESIFSILENIAFKKNEDAYKNKYYIDLFAGSGSLGLEAISRGVKFCYFYGNKPFLKILFPTRPDISKKSNFHAVKVKHVFPYSSVYLLAK